MAPNIAVEGAHRVVVGTVGDGGEGVAAGAGEEEHAEATPGPS